MRARCRAVFGLCFRRIIARCVKNMMVCVNQVKKTTMSAHAMVCNNGPSWVRARANWHSKSNYEYSIGTEKWWSWIWKFFEKKRKEKKERKKVDKTYKTTAMVFPGGDGRMAPSVWWADCVARSSRPQGLIPNEARPVCVEVYVDIISNLLWEYAHRQHSFKFAWFTSSPLSLRSWRGNEIIIMKGMYSPWTWFTVWVNKEVRMLMRVCEKRRLGKRKWFVAKVSS